MMIYHTHIHIYIYSPDNIMNYEKDEINPPCRLKYKFKQ